MPCGATSETRSMQKMPMIHAFGVLCLFIGPAAFIVASYRIVQIGSRSWVLIHVNMFASKFWENSTVFEDVQEQLCNGMVSE